jgi:hypothetical protein
VGHYFNTILVLMHEDTKMVSSCINTKMVGVTLFWVYFGVNACRD